MRAPSRSPTAIDSLPQATRSSSDADSPAAAAALARPLALVAVALLVANDHWAKRAYPGWLTGKLSDVAGMVFFPLLLAAFGQVVVARLGIRLPGRRMLAASCLATALVFALVKTTEIGNTTYRVGLGYLQWPGYALAAAAGGREVPPPRPVELLRDPSDLVALPFVGVAFALGARRRRPTRGRLAIPAV